MSAMNNLNQAEATACYSSVQDLDEIKKLKEVKEVKKLNELNKTQDSDKNREIDTDKGVLSLEHYLVSNSSTRAFFCSDDDSMVQRGIRANDLLVFDTGLEPYHQSLVIAKISSRLVCRVFDTERLQLIAANPAFSPISCERSDVEIKGVVRAMIKTFAD